MLTCANEEYIIEEMISSTHSPVNGYLRQAVSTHSVKHSSTAPTNSTGFIRFLSWLSVFKILTDNDDGGHEQSIVGDRDRGDFAVAAPRIRSELPPTVITVSATEVSQLLDPEYGMLYLPNCNTTTSALDFLGANWSRICLSGALNHGALWYIVFLRLRNILIYLLTYLLTGMNNSDVLLHRTM